MLLLLLIHYYFPVHYLLQWMMEGSKWHLYDNSGTLDFIRWDARSHVLYFSEAATFIWFYTESRIHVEFHPFLKIFHIWLTLTVKMCSIDLLLDDALLGRLLHCHMHSERVLILCCVCSQFQTVYLFHYQNY